MFDAYKHQIFFHVSPSYLIPLLACVRTQHVHFTHIRFYFIIFKSISGSIQTTQKIRGLHIPTPKKIIWFILKICKFIAWKREREAEWICAHIQIKKVRCFVVYKQKYEINTINTNIRVEERKKIVQTRFSTYTHLHIHIYSQ